MAVAQHLAVVVMGVTGTGKSTVAAGIASALGLECIDGDDLHTPEAVAKMRGGTPLTDDDRWPWLDRIGARLSAGRISVQVESPGAPASSLATDMANAMAFDTSAGTAADTGCGTEVDNAATARGTVVSCSALKRVYRDRLRAAAPGLHFIFLDGEPGLIHARMLARRNHYMPPGLLDSQLSTLQRPGADEPDVVALDIDAPVDVLVAHAVAALPNAEAR